MQSVQMQTVLGTIYGGLLALIVGFLVDILVAEPDLTDSHSPTRWLLFAAIMCVGVVLGAWRGRQLDKAKKRPKRSDDDEA